MEYMAPGMFIANMTDESPRPFRARVCPHRLRAAGAPPPPAHNGQAYWSKISGTEDGTFTVTNARNGFAKTYARR